MAKSALSIHRDLIRSITDIGFTEAYENFPERLALFFSQLAYFQPNTVNRLANKLACSKVHYIDIEGAQAYIFVFNEVIFVSFRGTEFNKIADISTAVNFIPKKITIKDRNYKIHRGFYNSYSRLHQRLIFLLNKVNKPIIFTGHSMGGALAQIAGLYYDYTNVYSFGSPRVFINRVNNPTTRSVNVIITNDIVTTIPWSLPSLEYRQNGEFVNLYRNKYRIISNHFLISYISSLLEQRSDGQNRTSKDVL